MGKMKGVHQQAVEAVCRYLSLMGCNVLERGWECERGSADVVYLDDGCLVIADVESKLDDAEGFPAEADAASYREGFERAALGYLADCGMTDMEVRCDRLYVVLVPPGRAFIKRHIGALSV